MTITLYARQGTGSAACEALVAVSGLECRVIEVEKDADGNTPAAFLAVNPLGQVPALVTEDGTLITESAAIMLWLADRADGQGLAPAIDSPDRAAYLRWMVLLATNNYMTDRRYFYPERYSADPDGAAGVRSAALAEKERLWRLLADFLSSRDWYVGTQMTALDIYAAMFTLWVDHDPDFWRQYPAIAAHAERIFSDPRMAKVWARHR